MKTLAYTIVITIGLFFLARSEAAYSPPFNMQVAKMSKQVSDTYKRIRDDMREDKNRTPPPVKDDKQIDEDNERSKIGKPEKGKKHD
jgi:hypothetical protein